MARILLFGRLSDAAGARTLSVSLGKEPLSIASLIERIGETNATLAAMLKGPGLSFAVNETLVARSALVSDSDEIAFLPPVSGG